MQRSLKTGFAQIFSCRPKNLSCPKFGGGLQHPSPARPVHLCFFLLTAKLAATLPPPPAPTSPQKRKHGHRHYL